MNITDIKTQNVKKILNSLRFCEGLTKKEIAAATDLSFSTVSNICNELKQAGVLIDEKAPPCGIGRLPNRLIFQSERFCTVCLDFQLKDVLGFAVLSFNNHVLYHHSYSISHCQTPEQMVAFAKTCYDEICPSLQADGITFVGVGVSVSGDYDRDTGCTVNSAIPTMEQVAIGQMVEQAFHLYCYIDNEANLCALSMRCQNPDIQNLLYLHISQGVGAGVICEGDLLRGHHGYAAEISHIPLGNPKLFCPTCHSYGCIEASLCLNGMTTTLQQQNAFTNLPWGALTQLVLEDPQAFEVPLRQIGQMTGVLLSVLYNFLDPEKVYIGGGITRLYPVIGPFIEACIQERCSFIFQKGYQLICDEDSDMTILLGLNQSIYEKWNGYQMTIPRT